MSDSAMRTRTDPRISRRRRAVARSRRRKIFTRVAVLLGMGALLWLCFFSPLLSVRSVVVAGASHTTPDAVARVAGLDQSDNILLLSTEDVARNVRSLPWVKKVTVDRKLFGSVKIRVVERRPAMILSLGAARWTVDGTGRVLEAGAAEGDLPVLAGAEVSDVEPGRAVASAEVAGALSAYSSMPRALRSQVEAVFAPTIERLTFAMTDGIQVRYGAAEQHESKNEVLRILLPRLRREGRTTAYVDVRVPQSPAVSNRAP
ncbi:MAG: cell division protein FtsQ/DivIB [Actinomycetota bacterium]